MPKHKVVGGKKSVKVKKARVQKAKPIYVSDDDIPDETADSFYKDDIDVHHEQSASLSVYSLRILVVMACSVITYLILL